MEKQPSVFDWKTNEPTSFSKDRDYTDNNRSRLAKRPKGGLIDPKLETPCPPGFGLVLKKSPVSKKKI